MLEGMDVEPIVEFEVLEVLKARCVLKIETIVGGR